MVLKALGIWTDSLELPVRFQNLFLGKSNLPRPTAATLRIPAWYRSARYLHLLLLKYSPFIFTLLPSPRKLICVDYTNWFPYLMCFCWVWSVGSLRQWSEGEKWGQVCSPCPCSTEWPWAGYTPSSKVTASPKVAAQRNWLLCGSGNHFLSFRPRGWHQLCCY